MFADDVKVFRAIRDPSNTETLQMNLCLIENWCITNAMSINAAKCSLVSFTRSAQPLVVSDYVLNGTVLSRSTIVRDLGVVFSADLSPDKHIDFICGKALRMLNFILRASRSGLGIVALNILYKSLLRPLLNFSLCLLEGNKLMLFSYGEFFVARSIVLAYSVALIYVLQD
ncbi:uncharacterized protein LOC124355781 [Homalodisca vitripennis]|uniref:uncharacterized protein LOC124355781 n=1 Tax=Homalodisca vitripennis TaxID=197043 RepID=UPI001EEAAB4A|nr:uncharacterized protein LOC124355781 [Homalodisca vitripennis]